MGQDKKVRGGKLTFILVRDIGEAFIVREVVPETVKALSGPRDRPLRRKSAQYVC